MSTSISHPVTNKQKQQSGVHSENSNPNQNVVDGDDYQHGGDRRTADKLCVLRQHPNYDENRRMFAVEWSGNKTMKVVERGTPLITESGDAIVKITTAAICGSDLHMFFNEIPGINVMQKGDVMGHEGVGVVESVGPQCTKFKVGDRVAVSAIIACGQCEYCKQEKPALCDMTNPSKEMEEQYGCRFAGVFGYTHLTGGYEGTQAEYVRVPLADYNLLKLPASVADEKAVFLSDVCCTAWHANELAEVSKGDTVAIWGAGPIGLMSGYLAKHVRGAENVIIIDRDVNRLKLARAEFATHTINFEEQTVVTAIQKLFPRGIDRCIDATGYRFTKTLLHKVERMMKLETDSSEVITEALSVCRKGGNLALIADYFGFANHFPIGMAMEKAITIRGGQLWAQKYWKTLLPLIENGKIDPTFMVTHTLPLDDAPRGYEIFSTHDENCIKVLLKTRFAAEWADRERSTAK